jgi:hypothetical protein
MQNPLRTHAESHRFGLRIVALAALIYCVWLGAHWLPLNWSDKELAASASRVWDVKRELTQGHGLPWWTPHYMSGSSYALNYSRGFYLLPWLLFSAFTSLEAAGKLVALCAIFTSAVTMYFCARHFLRHEWAAVLAGMAYMLCPEQLTRAATQEHITINLFMPFIPLLWWLFAQTLQTGKFRDIFWCALAFVFAMWTDYKQVFVQGVFLLGYLLYWLWQPKRRSQRARIIRTCAVLGAVFLGLGAAFLVPGFVESRYVKLFAGDSLEAWQHTYAFKSVLALVDRGGSATRETVENVIHKAQSGDYHPISQQDVARLQTQINRVVSLQMDSPEKYAGLVLLALIAWSALFNRGRTDRRLFWFCIGATMVSVALGTGFSSVASASWITFTTLMALNGVPASMRLTTVVTVVIGMVGLTFFTLRKLTTPRKWVIAGMALIVFLFVPLFGVVAHLPAFKEIRAPSVFYSQPFSFIGALLAGFFVTDVLEAGRWRAHLPKIVGMLAVLLLFDYWPYQKSMKDNAMPVRTLQNLEATYSSFRKDPDWVKTYSVSGRYFHLLGPMYGGKPQVYEAFYNWMCPLGTGLLNQQGLSSWDNHRAFLNLMGARYVVFDKTDPDMQSPQMKQVLASYRQTFPFALENYDFAVFRNDGAHPYVTGYSRACLFDGDFRNSAQLALALAARNLPLVYGPARGDAAAKYERVYRDGEAPMATLHDGETVPLADVQLVREDAQRVRIYLTAPRDCLIVIAESYYPLWHAEVDGKHAEVLRVSCGLMGLELPAGAHEIVLRYEPPRAYSVAGCVSALAFFACFGIMIWDTRRSSTTRSSVASLRPS